ncbi:efflux transporter outer membrane subunit [Chlamydiota bacterium]
MRRYFTFLTLCIFLSGCLLGPNYRPPENAVPDEWNAECAPLCPPEASPPIAWWELFSDPYLNTYIERAALYNNDILNAEANILQARAMRQVTASALFPQVSADLNATRTYFSKNGPVFAIQNGGGANMVTGLPFQIQIPQIQNLYNALIDVSWEIDLFGKTRRAIEAACDQIGGAIASRNDVLISVLAEVARNYMELRSAQRQGQLIEENIDLLEKTQYISEKRLQAGYINRLDFDRVDAELAQARASLPDVLAQIYQNIYALSVLTGALPETLLSELLPIEPLPSVPRTACVGLRSDLLRRRPDVRVAERRLAAATANIGVAVASFFPTFTLLGDIGFQSLKLSNLFQARSVTWAIGGDVNVPLFTGGRLTGNLHLAEAQAISAAFTYQQTVLRALQEAETALIAYTNELQTADDLSFAVEKYESLVALTRTRNAKGLVSITDVLDIERQWITSAQNLLSSETAALVDLITLYKALGGGWEPVDGACIALP